VTPVRVLIVDDLEPFRRAARAVVDATPGFEVAAEVFSGEEAVTAAVELVPDLILMDLNLPGIDGVEATRQILARSPGTLVLLLSTREQDEVGPVTAEAGAAAYIAKSSFSSERLAEAWAADGARHRRQQ
jgi:DNA-binding NarL/FixJ family response regulator